MPSSAWQVKRDHEALCDEHKCHRLPDHQFALRERHWRHDRQTRTFELVAGRRPAGYVVASGDSRAFDDPGIFVEIPLVNRIRPRVRPSARQAIQALLIS